MNLLREYIRELINESYFPIYSGDKLRVHHSRPGTRSDGEPQIDGFSQKIGMKPNGLWYECQDGSSESWEEFCEAGLSDGYSKYDGTYNVVLEGDGYYMLNISDEQHFDKFVEMYGVSHPVFPNDPAENLIDWPKVAEHYSGIEICPYLSSRRDVSWYYGWDVASGCVWSPSGIKQLIKAGDCR